MLDLLDFLMSDGKPGHFAREISYFISGFSITLPALLEEQTRSPLVHRVVCSQESQQLSLLSLYTKNSSRWYVECSYC
jgi:transcriptional regulator of acetoin/glycerol metabolism